MNRMAVVADLATTTALVTIAAIFAGPVLLNGGGSSGQGPPVRAAAAFEVVSIKVNTSGQPVGVIPELFQLRPGGRFVISNVTLKQLVLLAYRSEVTAAHISGGPAWFDSERYNVEAVAAPGTVPATLTGRGRARLLEEMMQSLLADRFKLRVRREIRQADVYALVVARGGPKLIPAKNQNCAVTEDPATRCHQTSGGVNRGLIGVSVDMDDVANHLQLAVVVPDRVINRTGINGLYDVTVTWRRSERARPNPDGPNAGTPTDAEGADAFTALQEQIGLRLERQKAPVNFVIVESAERPSEN